MGNVLINGRTAVHAGSKGTLTSVDICLTQIGQAVVPIPYCNVARSSDAAGAAGSILINGHPACHKDATFSKSSGDEAGNGKGLISGTIQEQAEFITASSNVFIEGVAAVRAFDLMTSNRGNTPPSPLMQPGAGAPPSGALEMVSERRGSESLSMIVWEVAGFHPQRLKGILEIAPEPQAPREEDPREIVRKPVGAGEQKEGRRELIFSVSPGRTMVWLKLRDAEFGWNHLPLGPVEPEKQGEVTKGTNVLVPVIPLRYSGARCDEEEADKLSCGWIYVYRREAGKEVPLQLWRELAVDDAGYFRDVHLNRMEGKDDRRVTGFGDNRILLPYKVFNVAQEIFMAHSTVQWSWVRVQEVAEDAELQGEYLQRIPLAGYQTNFARNTPAVSDAVVKSVEEAPHLYHLSLLRKEKVPVVYLRDPLGCPGAPASVSELNHRTDPSDPTDLSDIIKDRKES